jgi:hypothetical protein
MAVIMVTVSLCADLLPWLSVAKTPASQDEASVRATSDSSRVCLLTCNHDRLVLWGSDHFAEHFRSAVEWADSVNDFNFNFVAQELCKMKSRMY